MDEGEKVAGGDALAAYVQTLFPFQQQAIATAQLAGCRFEGHAVERHLPWDGAPVWRWITTTEYKTYLPDGTFVGHFQNIYEGALACLIILDTPDGTPRRGELGGAFKLNPENEQ